MCPWAQIHTALAPNSGIPEDIHWFHYNHYKTPSGWELSPLSVLPPWSTNIQDTGKIRWIWDCKQYWVHRDGSQCRRNGLKQLFEELSFPSQLLFCTTEAGLLSRKGKQQPQCPNLWRPESPWLMLILLMSWSPLTHNAAYVPYSHCPLWVYWWWSSPPWGGCWARLFPDLGLSFPLRGGETAVRKKELVNK